MHPPATEARNFCAEQTARPRSREGWMDQMDKAMLDLA